MATPQLRVLAVDDHPESLFALEQILKLNGYEVETASDASEALQRARSAIPHVILCDVVMPGIDGFQLSKTFKTDPILRYTPLILVTGRDSLNDIIRGLDAGADDYITKPYESEELLARLRAALRLRRTYDELRSTEERNRDLVERISSHYHFHNIIGESPAMKEVFLLLEKVAKADSPALITGASGTGKELVARAIHFNSRRKAQPFVAKNCAAFNEQLLESELFGHKRGAFTGAIADKPGLFESAHSGTLFLDELGEMSQTLQAKLLRVLQDGTFIPVGGTVEQKADVRVIAATNRILENMVKNGTFREDLYYRLNVINIHLPPLTERRTDIVLLAQHFLQTVSSERGEPRKRLTPDALEALLNYSWQGNVRELHNEIERMLILAGEETELDISFVSSRIRESNSQLKQEGEAGEVGRLRDAIEKVEREVILETLKGCNWNKSVAARELGISRSNLIAKVQHYGLLRR